MTNRTARMSVARALASSTLERRMLALAQHLAMCAVCGSSKADNTAAFMLTTLALAVVPVLLFGCGVFFIVRAHRRGPPT